MDYVVDTSSDTANRGERGNVCPPAPDACSVPTCNEGTCGSAPVVCPNDGNECTTSTCDPEIGRGSEPVADNAACNEGAGVRVAGTCTTPEAITA